MEQTNLLFKIGEMPVAFAYAVIDDKNIAHLYVTGKMDCSLGELMSAWIDHQPNVKVHYLTNRDSAQVDEEKPWQYTPPSVDFLKKEDRERMYWYFQDILNRYDFAKANEPQQTHHQLIAGYLEDQRKMAEAMSEYADFTDQVREDNEIIMQGIKALKGKSFHRHLVNLMSDVDVIDYEKMQITREDPKGEWQNERGYGREIKGIYINQWSTGTEGDSFSGIIWVPLKPGRYLRYKYNC